MNKILSYVRRCVEDYDMIQPGDRIAVGVSGGKDSLTLLAALARLRSFYPKPFTVEAFTLDMGHVDGGTGMDFAPVAALCRELEVPFTLLPSEIHHIIFDLRREKNPCSMCAKMRRGALHNALAERGIRKIALGHHFDDAVETFFLSLFYEGRISCFQPVTHLDRTDIVQIRPLLYCGEGMIRGGGGPGGTAGGLQPLPRRRDHQAAGGQGPDPGPGPSISRAEKPGDGGYAAAAPARVGPRRAPPDAAPWGLSGWNNSNLRGERFWNQKRWYGPWSSRRGGGCWRSATSTEIRPFCRACCARPPLRLPIF